jgi:N-acetylmuramic acid 6-phosphate etherase
MDLSDTESLNPVSAGIDEKSIEEILLIINEEDEKVPNIVRKEIPRIAAAVELVIESLGSGGNIFLLGSGTSGRLGVMEAAEIPPTFGLSTERFQGLVAGGCEALTRAVERAEDDFEEGLRSIKEKGAGTRDLVIGISASGITPFVLGGVEGAKKIG